MSNHNTELSFKIADSDKYAEAHSWAVNAGLFVQANANGIAILGSNARVREAAKAINAILRGDEAPEPKHPEETDGPEENVHSDPTNDGTPGEEDAGSTSGSGSSSSSTDASGDGPPNQEPVHHATGTNEEQGADLQHTSPGDARLDASAEGTVTSEEQTHGQQNEASRATDAESSTSGAGE